MQVVGVDGCRGGWVAAVWDTQSVTCVCAVFPTFSALLAAHRDAERIGVDIPIGLPQRGARSCDVQARRVLGPRKASVFPAPARPLLGITDFAEALATSRRLADSGLSLQAFGLLAKIGEVDAALQSGECAQGRVIEVHPELSFWVMHGHRPMSAPKKRLEGFNERRELLERELPAGSVPASRTATRQLANAGADDILDAMVVAWTALRDAEGRSIRLPATPELDETGLRMEIVY
jgi:predicted RNase H-like nuclease